MLAGLTAAVISGVGTIGPLVLAGGPIGGVIAWLGTKAASKTAKAAALIGGLLILIGTAVAVTVYWQHLERDSAAYKTLSAKTASLEEQYGCTKRPEHERDLSTCLEAREREAAEARQDEIDRQRKLAAEEQSRLDKAAADLDARRRAEERAIDADAAHDDGAVPKALLNSWERERSERGIK